MATPAERTKIQVRYLDGGRFGLAVGTGSLRVIGHEKELNRLNVFPIPDKDTGSNLKKTFTPIIAKLPFSGKDLARTSSDIAATAVSSAMGYSGIIFSQFFVGLAEGFMGITAASVQDFAKATSLAVKHAYEAVKYPQEGTVLSVYKAFFTELNRLADLTEDFVTLLKGSLASAHTALQETPQLLKVLRKHKVVDAGGKAFVYFLEGILDFIGKGSLRTFAAERKSIVIKDRVAETGRGHAYCVECCIRKKNLNRQDLVDALNASGKDLIFYGSRDFAKIRIHTEHAERVFSVIAKFGVISAAKSLEIRQDIAVREKKPIALVADTTCDLSDEYIESSDIYFVPIKIQAEDRVYTDKLNIIPEEFYDIMTASPGLPKTSQPSLMDFQRVYENLLGDYQEIISVQLSSHLSGTYQTALQAAKSVAPGRIAVVDSKNLSVGLGLIMIEGINGLKENISRDALLRRLEYAIDNTNIHVGIPTLKYLIKGGRITKAKGLVAKILNINPILGINREGRLETIGKTFGFQSIERKVLDIAFARISRISSNQGVPGPPSSHRERASVSFAVVHSNARQLAERVSQKITEKTGEKPEMVMNASPVLGAHAGPGAVAVAILKHE